ADAFIVLGAAQVGGVHQSRTRRVDLGHKCFEGAAAVAGLKGVGGREIGRACEARHIGVARAVHSNAIAPVVPAAAQVGGIHLGRTSSVDLGHECIVGTAA